MKKFILVSMLILTFATIGLAQDPGWPRLKSNSSGRLVYYQPQVDDWSNYKDLDFRMAFSLTPTGGKSVVGVVSVHAQTDVNVDNRTALFFNPTITRTDFPSLDPSTASQMNQLVRTFLPSDYSVTISLDRLVASANKKEAPATVNVLNDPPAIFVSNRPAILLQTDGQPVLADIPNTKIRFVVNTSWPVFFDVDKSNYYLFTEKLWLTTNNLQGPWSQTTKLPKDMSKLAKDSQWSSLANAAIPAPPAAGIPIPTVFYSNNPAEVILFNGQPVYAPVSGTQLVRATNTDSDLFVYSPTQQIYYLAAGRWFSASSLNGPWTYATPGLPADFANIPASSPASRVLVSVPGTEQAKDAVLLAQIPTTVTVNATTAAAKVIVQYSGAPEFKPIEGTSMSYATNTADRVIKVNSAYFLCQQGIWFMSLDPQGPWTTAAVVPKDIYTIPPSAPVYNVTYVTQTMSSDGNVEASYTAGYFGSFIVGATVGAIICSGSGYYYPPYFYYPAFGYPYYRPYVATYGVGSFYNTYTGSYGVARGVYGPYGGAGGWASYNPYTGNYSRGVTAYGPYGSVSAARSYNPYTGTYARGATASTAYGSRTAAGAYNPYTGAGAATRQGSSPYAQWGTSVAGRGNQAVQTGHITTSQGTIAGARTTSGGKAVRTSGGDVYASKDGNVYKKSGGQWQSYQGGSWNPGQSRQDNLSSLNQEFQNRQRGALQNDRFQSMQRSGGFGGGGRGGFGGGGRGGFGGRRR